MPTVTSALSRSATTCRLRCEEAGPVIPEARRAEARPAGDGWVIELRVPA
jgi:hypothetical protein